MATTGGDRDGSAGYVTVRFAELEGASREEIGAAIEKLSAAVRAGSIPHFSDADRLAMLRVAARSADQGAPRVRARLARLAGEEHEAAGDIDQAVTLYQRALALHEGVGVKRRLERLQRGG
jgi:hypothetical protein